MKNFQWANAIGLILGFLSLYFELLTPLWGLLFLWWVYYGFKEGRMLFITYAYKKENPVLFWLISILWILISLLFILYPFFPQYLK